MKKYTGALLTALALVSCSPETTVENTPNFAKDDNPAFLVEDADARQLANAINQHRQSIGMPPLRTVGLLCEESAAHNQYMMGNRIVSHDGFESRARLIIDVMNAAEVRENIAYNYPTASVIGAWLASSNHRENMEGDFTHIGVSVQTDQLGKKYHTAIFVKAEAL